MKTYRWMFVATLFVSPQLWKQPKYPLTGEWINKVWYTQTVEFYLSKRNELLTNTTTWTNPEIIIPREVKHKRVHNI